MKKLFTIISILWCVNANSQCIPNSSSLSLNGTSSYGNVPINPLLVMPGPVTIEAWIYATAFTTAVTPSANSIVCHHGWQYGEQGYVLRAGTTGAATGQLSFNFAGIDTNGNYVSWVDVLSAAPLSLNTWYHVAGSFDGDTSRCYVNGVLSGETPFKGTIRDSSAYDLKIGRLAYTSGAIDGRFWHGLIDEVRIWNRALPAAELLANMNHHIDAAAQTGLIAYYRFNEAAGNSFADETSNHLDGTLTSATWSTTNVPFNTPGPAANLTWSGGLLSVNPPSAHYQWYHNGAPLPNDTLQTWHPVLNGQYFVQVTDSNGCSALSGTVNITNIGINEHESADAITVYSNAGQHLIDVQLPDGMKAEQVALTDVNGKTVAQFESSLMNTFKLHYTNTYNGIYFLRINTADNSFTKKLMITQ